MIDLGLARTTRLLKSLGNPHLAGWKAVHVAGTNGKGSVCAYLSSCFHQANIATGRFTSPHLIDRWDCIWINGKTVSEELFVESEKRVLEVNERDNIRATSFEILTATAFELFRRQRVEIAVIEVGLGGRLDSTNVLAADKTLATVITKIGLDHQGFLGDTLEEIAYQKAGIIKDKVPCVIDGTNQFGVIEEVKKEAELKNSKLVVATPENLAIRVDKCIIPLQGDYQEANLSTALAALASIEAPSIKEADIIEGIKQTTWPGRLQWVHLPKQSFLIDGAHNTQAAELLRQYVDKNIRIKSESGALTYVMAFSEGKNFDEILRILVRPGDRVVATTFGKVAGMPWVTPVDAGKLQESAKNYTHKVDLVETNVDALAAAGDQSVVCGSLYLASDILRHIRDHEKRD